MAALGVQIAEAVLALIEGATFNQPVFAERQWVETQQRENMKETDIAHVIVVPKNLNVTAFDLKPRNAFVWDIGVWTDKAVQTTNEACDPVAELVEEIVNLLVFNRNLLIEAGQATLIGITPDPAYDSVQLLDIRVFRSVFLATYRITQ
jgi:hypothetical protein